MLFALGQAGPGGSSTLSVVDGVIVFHGLRVTSLADVVHVCAHGARALAVTRTGAVYRFQFKPRNCRVDVEYYTEAVRVPPSLFGETPVDCVSLGPMHFLALFADGRVGGAGFNVRGCLGRPPRVLPQTNDLLVPLDGGALEAGCAVSVVAGVACSVVVNTRGQALGVGCNGHGQFGLGHERPCYAWTLLGLESVVTLDMSEHLVAVLQDGTVRAAGMNNVGQLGLGDLVDRSRFERVDVPPVGSVACGYSHTVIVDRTGTVRVCGQHEETGPVASSFWCVPGLPAMAQVAEGDASSGGLSRDGRVFVWGDTDLAPTMMLAGISLEERRRPLAATLALAFLMSQHARLGAASMPGGLAADLARRIVEASANRERASERAMRGEW